MAADYVFLNAEVITVNPRDDIAQAVAVKGNEVCAVGTNEEIRRFAGSETQVIDLQGNSLLPGFIDSHLHMLLYGTNQLGVDCKNGVGSIEVGKLADLVALDGSMLSSSPEQILSMKPTLTMIDGEIVFESEGDRTPGERSQLAPAAHPAD